MGFAANGPQMTLTATMASVSMESVVPPQCPKPTVVGTSPSARQPKYNAHLSPDIPPLLNIVDSLCTLRLASYLTLASVVASPGPRFRSWGVEVTVWMGRGQLLEPRPIPFKPPGYFDTNKNVSRRVPHEHCDRQKVCESVETGGDIRSIDSARL